MSDMHIVSVNKILFYANKYDLHMNNKLQESYFYFCLKDFQLR